MKLYHGGVPGLRPGDRLTPGHSRNGHHDCEYCRARERGGAHLGVDPPSKHAAVYATPSRIYAMYHASLYGRGDLYRVEMASDAFRSDEDSFETWCAPAACIVAVLDRAVLLTDSERRRLRREWRAGDIARGKPALEFGDFEEARRHGMILR